LADFPKSVLQLYGIEALSPDEMILQVIQQKPNRALITIKNHRSQLTRPSLSANEYLEMLEKQRLPTTVAFLREHESNL